MKFHLPKKLLLAVLAAMVSQTVYAGYYQIAERIGVDEKGNSVSETIKPGDINDYTETYAPVAKDGSGTVTINEAGVIASPIFVREGQFIIEGKDIEVQLQGYPVNANGLNGNGFIPLSVAGKDSVMTVSGARLDIHSWGAALTIGGADGSGRLELKDGAEIDNWNGFSCFIGYPGYTDATSTSAVGFMNLHATTATSDGSASSLEDRYQGTYYQASNGYDRQYGRGEVLVSGGSYFNMGSIGALYMAEGSLIIEGASTVEAGTEETYRDKHTSILGRMSGCTSIVEVKEKSTLHIRQQLSIGYSQNTDSIVTVDDSTLQIDGDLNMAEHRYDSSQKNINADLILQNNAKAVVNKNVVIGSTGNEVSIQLDKTSSLTVGSTVSVKDTGASITNLGTLQAKTIELTNGGSLSIDCATASTTASITGDQSSKLTLNNAGSSESAIISGSLCFASGFTVDMTLASALTGDELKIAVADSVSALQDVSASTLNVNSILWDISDAGWLVEDNIAYITATMSKKESVSITDDEVTLDSANALGDTTVSTAGDTTLSTGTDVTVALPDTITNTGNLTISGTYDGTSLETIEVEDTRVCVDGKEGNNGFYREGGSAILVVDNQGNGTLTVEDGTTVQGSEGALKLYASGLAAGELDYSNYHIEDDGHEASMSEIQAMRPDADEPLTISMNEGTLVADADATDVKSTGGTIETKGDVAVGGELAGSTAVTVGAGTTTLSGDNSYTGDTTISGETSTLIVADEKALGASKVQLHNKGTLDLNNKAVGNYINVTGCELHNASAYTGNMDVSGNLTICGSNATANVVNMVNGGSIAASASETLTVNTMTVSGGDSTIAADLVINPDGSVVLNDGSQLTVTKSLTLGAGTTIVLNGGEYSKDDVLLTSAATTAPASGVAVLSYGHGTYVLEGNDIILTAVFNQNIANACTVSNWGIATASRAVVNAIRGQRTNTGCIADGKGTAWAAVLGGNHDVAGSDINLKGAAVGADMKVGTRSSVGIAVGYIDGEVEPSGLRDVDQEGTYVALYGEHGLKKLSSTSCLSLDWVAAYGNTESEGTGVDWEQDSLQLNTRLNWNKKVNDKLCMSVFGGLEYFASNSDTVEGVKTGSLQNLRGEIGVGARYVAWGTPGTAASHDEKGAMVTAGRPGCEKLVLHGEVRYMNDMVRSNPVIRMDGLSGGGENPGRQGMGIEAGATYRIGERWSASANYGYNMMNDSREHRVNVGASYTF